MQTITDARLGSQGFASQIAETQRFLDANSLNGTERKFNDNKNRAKPTGLEAVCEGFVEAQLSGTPAEIIERVQARREIVGDFDVLFTPYYGGMSSEMAVQSLELLSKEVLPVLHESKVVTF